VALSCRDELENGVLNAVANIHLALPAIITFAFLLLQAGLPNPTDDRDLFEFGTVSYLGGTRFPHTDPPRLRVYESGKFVVEEDNRYVEGLLTPAELGRLKTQLSRNPLLSKSQVVSVSRGEPIMLHGGFALIRYLDDESQVIVVAEMVPTRGPMADLIQRVRSFRPRRLQPFTRDVVTVSATAAPSTLGAPATCSDPPPPNLIWPFENRVPLLSLLDKPTSVGSEISRSLFDQIYRRKAGLSSFDYCQGGKLYWLFILGVPGWHDDGIQFATALEAQALLDESKKAGQR
jgi:hypothetical protein